MNLPTFIIALTGFSVCIWIVSVLLLLIGLTRIKQAKILSNVKYHLRVSILIAVRNEEQNIKSLLNALDKQTYPDRLWEVIILNDYSTDQTGEIVKSHIKSHEKYQLIRISDRPSGIAPKKFALIQGLKHASGDVILTTDGDCVPQPGWIEGIISEFHSGADAVVGFSPLRGAGIMGKIGAFDAFVNAVISAGSIGIGFPTTAVGRNFGYTRKVWEEVDGFGDTAEGASGDDDLLLQRIAAHGGKVAFAAGPSSHVYSQTKDSFSAWWKMKRRHYSAGKRYQFKFVVIGAFFYALQIGLLASVILAGMGLIPLWLVMAVWLSKSLADGLTLARGAAVLGYNGWLVSYLIAELISPIILALLVPLSFLGKIEWKGRKLKR